MGYPMARNLMRAGHEVALWSYTAAKAKELAAAENGVFCETPRQVGEQAECIFLCVGELTTDKRGCVARGAELAGVEIWVR